MRYDRFAGACATTAAIGGVGFSLIFVAIVAGAPEWVGGVWMSLLILGSLLGIVVLVALYCRLVTVEPGVALLALVLGLIGAMGAIAHGGQVLELIVKPPPGLDGAATFELDPRGIFRYGVSGLSLLALGWLMERSDDFPRVLTRLGYLGGALLLAIYLGRLTQVIRPDRELTLAPPVLFGLVVSPAWYFLVGRVLGGRRPALPQGETTDSP